MIPEQIVKTLLTGDAAVVALAGNRIKPAPLPERMQLPAVAFMLLSTMQIHRPLSVTAGSFYLCRSRVRIVAVELIERYVAEKSLIAAVRRAVGNKVGTVAGFDGVHIGPPMQPAEMPDPIVGLRQEAADFLITFRDPVA